MLFKLPNEERIQVEHVERVTRPRKTPEVNSWSFQIHFSSGASIPVDGDQDSVELTHRQLISAMSDRP